MNAAARVVLAGLVLIGAARAALYLAYAASTLPMPLETFHLEAKMVLLADRAASGLSLYPSWEDYPHVANFFGPVDFWLVGRIGRLMGADLRGLFLIGRGVSFASGLLTAAVLGVWAGRTYGRGAGWVAAVTSLGVAPMIGFSVMTRPDMLAEGLGLVGFLLAGARAAGWKVAGAVLLVAAIFTKQSTVAYLVAAGLGLAWEGRRGWGIGVVAGGLGATAVVVAIVTRLIEPNFARSLVAEGKTPWLLPAWGRLLGRLALGAPDLLVLPALGLALWTRGRWHAPRLAALAAVLLAFDLATSAKKGADLNYFLGLRAVAALAVATLWADAREPGPGRRPRWLLAGSVLAAASLVPSTLAVAAQAQGARATASFFASPVGRPLLETRLAVARRASEPDSRILTDSGFVDLHLRDRAAFGDPWLFRMLVESGQIRPARMVERIAAGDYDLVVTTADVFQPSYDSYEFGLPMALAEALRRRYEPAGVRASWFFYRPRPRKE